jgi:hypothetical protein
MASIKRDLDAMETESYTIAARREVVVARAPRRESPRFGGRSASASGIGGMHQRRNKRSGL